LEIICKNTEKHKSSYRKNALPIHLIEAMKSLKEDPSIIIRSADKNLGFAIMDTEWYNLEIQTIQF